MPLPPVATIPPAPPVSGLLVTETGRNGFDVPRAFLTVTTPMGETIRGRLTLDAGRLGGNPGPLGGTLRHAYVEGDAPNGAWRLGLTLTPWLSYENGLWKNRLQGPLFTARQGWVQPSDFGMALAGRAGALAYDVGLYNGEGFLKAERDHVPSPQGRVSLDLGGGWEVSGFAQWTATDGDLELGALARRSPLSVVAAELVRRSFNQVGGSAYGWWTFQGDHERGFDLLGRLDVVQSGGSYQPRTITGIAYRPNPRFKVLVDAEREQGPTTYMVHTSYQL